MKRKIIVVVVFVALMLIPAYSGCFNDIPMSESAKRQLKQPGGKRDKNSKPYEITVIEKNNLLMLEAINDTDRYDIGFGYISALKRGLINIAQNYTIIRTEPIMIEVYDASAIKALLVYVKPQ